MANEVASIPTQPMPDASQLVPAGTAPIDATPAAPVAGAAPAAVSALPPPVPDSENPYLLARAPVVPPVADSENPYIQGPQSATSDIGRALKHAPIGIERQAGEASQFLGHAADQAGFTQLGAFLAQKGASLTQDAASQEGYSNLPSIQSQTGGLVRSNVYGATEGLAQTGAFAGAGAAAGAAAGLLGGPLAPATVPIGAALGATLGMLAQLPLFAGSAGEQTYEGVKGAQLKAGASDADANSTAMLAGAGSAGVMGGLQFVLQKVGLGGIVAPALERAAGATAGNVVAGVLDSGLRKAATSVATTAGEVAGVTAAQTDLNAAINQAGGNGDGPTLEGTASAAVQGLGMGLVMGAGGAARESAHASATARLLADTDANPLQRGSAALGVSAVLQAKDKGLAQDFGTYAAAQITKGLPIEVAPDAFYQAAANEIRNPSKFLLPAPAPVVQSAPPEINDVSGIFQATDIDGAIAEAEQTIQHGMRMGEPITPADVNGIVNNAMSEGQGATSEQMGSAVNAVNNEGTAAGVITPAGSEMTPSAENLAGERDYYQDQANQAQQDMRNQAFDQAQATPAVPADAFAQRQAQLEAEQNAQREAAFQQGNRDQLADQADQATAVSKANEPAAAPTTPTPQAPATPLSQAMQATMDQAAGRMQRNPSNVTTATLGMLAQHHPDPAVQAQAAQLLDARANKATVFSPDQPSTPLSLNSVREGGNFAFSPERAAAEGQEAAQPAAGAPAEPVQQVRPLEQTEAAVAPVKAALDQQAATLGRPASSASIEPVDPATLPETRTAANNGVEGATTLSKSDYALAQKQGEMFGKKVVLFRQNGGETGQVDGMASPDGKTIYLNADAAGAHHLVVVGHELAHTMRTDAPALFEGLRNSLLKSAGKGAMSDFYRYYMNERGMSDADVKTALKDPATRDNMTEEYVADLVGNRMGEYRTWQQMFANADKANRPMVYRIADYITKFIDKLLNNESFKKFATDDMVSNLTTVRQAVRKALSEYAVGEGSKAMQHEADQLRARQENMRAGIEPRKLVEPVENGRADVGKAPSKAAPAPVAERDAPAVQGSEGREPMRGPKRATDEAPVKDEAARQQRSQDSAKAELDDAQATALETAGKETNERNAKQKDAELRTLDVVRKDSAAEREPVAETKPVAEAKPAEAQPAKPKAITQDMLARSEADIEKAREAAKPTLDAIQKHFEDDKDEAGLNDIVGRDVAAENRTGENAWNTAERLAQSKVDEAQAAHDRLEEQYNAQQKAKPLLDQETTEGITRRQSIDRDVAAGRTQLTRVKGKESTWWELHHPDGGEGSLLLHPEEAAHAKKAIKANRDAANQQLADQAAQDIANRKADRSAKASATIRKQYHVDPTKDSMMTAVAKLGGVKTSEAHSLYGDQGQYYHGIKQALSSKGRSVDAMRSALAELGYVKTDAHGKADIQDFDDKFTDGLNGNEHYTPDGELAQAEAHAKDEKELNAQDVQNEDYNEAPEHAQDLTDQEIHDGPLTAAEEAALAEHDNDAHGDVPFDDEPSSTSDTEDPFGDDTENRGLAPEDRAPKPEGTEAGDRPVAATEQASTPEAGERSGEGSEGEFGLKGETPEQGEARLRQEDAERKARTRAALDEERRMQADEDAKTFRLTGSDREADADPDQTGFKFSPQRAQTRTPPFKKWFGESKVVDRDGNPLVAYRGEHGDSTEQFHSRMNSLTFTDEPETASLYAQEPNNTHEEAHSPRVTPAYLRIERPIMENHDGDPFIEMADIRKGLGDEEALRIARKFSDPIENTGNWMEEINAGNKYKDVNDFLDKHPDRVDDLYFDAFRYLDDPAEVENLKAHGFDGAIHGSNGAGFGSTEYRVFDEKQVKSAIGNNGSFDGSNSDARFSRQRASSYLGPLTKDQERDARAVGALTTPKTAKQVLDNLKSDLGKKLTQGIADQFYPIKELSKEAYQASRMSKGYTGTLEATLLYGKPFLRDGVPDVDVSDEGYAHMLSALNGEQSRFFLWMAAHRAEDLMKQGKENLFTADQIRTLKTLDQPDASNPDRAQLFKTALQKHTAFNDAVLDLPYKSGLIDKATRDEMASHIYVPFYRVLDEGDRMRGPAKGDALINQAAWKKLRGDTKLLNEDLLANTLANWGHLMGASARNTAARLTMDAAVKAGAATPVAYDRAGKNAVRVMVNGKAKFYEVTDPHLLTAVSAMSASVPTWMKPLATFKRMLTTGTTLAPSFRLNNLIRDTLSTLATTDISLNPVKNLVQGIKSQAHGSQTHASMLASGGIINFGTMLEGNEARRTHQLIKMGVDKATILNNPGAVNAFWTKVKQAGEFYHEIGNKVENANRGALYEQLRAKGVNHADASFQARDIMDFSLQGSNNVVRFLTTAVPFLNARIQGAYKIGRAVGENPQRAGAVMGAVAMGSLALMLHNQDDPDWKARPDWDRDNYWWFKVGKTAYRIPKPFEVGAVGTVVERTWEKMFDPEMTNSRYIGELRDVLMSQFNLNPTPQIVKPLLNVYANRDDFTGNQIESSAMQSMTPEQRYTPYTSMTSRFLGKLGLPDPTQLMLGRYSKLSPVQMDSLIRGYFGWTGTMVTSMADSAIRPFSSNGAKPALTLRQKTLGFMDDLPANQSRYADQLYQNAEASNQAYASWQAAIKSGQPGLARDIRNGTHILGPDNKQLIQEHGVVTNIAASESRLALQEKRIADSPNLSADTKRAMLNKIEAQRNNLARIGSTTELRLSGGS